MAPLQKLQSRCFGGQSPEATDVSTCESSFSLLHSPSCIRTTSPSPPPSPLSLLSPLSLVHPLTLPSHQHRLLLVSRAGRHCPKAESAAQGWVWASASSSPTHPSSSICRHLKIFLIVFLREGDSFSKCLNSKGQNINFGKIPACLLSRYCTHFYQALMCKTVALLEKM